VIAAYNCGAGNVNSAIRKSGSRNFWDLQYYLPAESRNHVKKFIATHYIMEGDAGMTTLTRKETDELGFVSDAVDPNTTVLNITGKYNSFAIAQSIQMDLAAFLKMNPNFDKQLSANGSYGLRLPLDKMNLFQLNKQQILEQSIRILLGTANR
jgi:membrane-bound lytic murein transglycosylase D